MNGVKKVLIVGCRFDEDRNGGARPWRVPQAMAPVFLAGAFNPRICDVRVYSELFSGPLERRRLLAWPDMLVLSGLQVDFDRFLQLAAYARSLNPAVIVVAGGSLIEILPKYAGQFFDYCCTGPVEDIRGVIVDAFGPDYAAPDPQPRHDLAYFSPILGMIESSRYCNFRCAFCAMSIIPRRYTAFDPAEVRRAILRTGRKTIFFLDNNFYGNDPRVFEQKLCALAAMRQRGELRSWGAEVTMDFFLREGMLDLVQAAGCSALFCGVESFDRANLLAFNKRQNLVTDQIALIQRCLEHGVLFLYGLMLDPTRRTLGSLDSELEFVLRSPEIPLPSYITLPIPLLGTRFFFETLDAKAILPQTRVRDLDGVTLCLRPLEGLDRFQAWWPGVLRLATGRRARAIRHDLGFIWRYRRSLDGWRRVLSVASLLGLCLPKYRRRDRTFVSTTERLDPQYRPTFRVDGRWAPYFRPTPITDAVGELAPAVEEVLRHRPARVTPLGQGPAIQEDDRSSQVGIALRHQPGDELAALEGLTDTGQRRGVDVASLMVLGNR